jgi:hypothetical protein
MITTAPTLPVVEVGRPVEQLGQLLARADAGRQEALLHALGSSGRHLVAGSAAAEGRVRRGGSSRGCVIVADDGGSSTGRGSQRGSRAVRASRKILDQHARVRQAGPSRQSQRTCEKTNSKSTLVSSL